MKKIIATILACVLMLTVSVSAFAASFPDLEASRWDWARDTVNELADKGIVKGYSDGTYQPEKKRYKPRGVYTFCKNNRCE